MCAELWHRDLDSDLKLWQPYVRGRQSLVRVQEMEHKDSRWYLTSPQLEPVVLHMGKEKLNHREVAAKVAISSHS
jgi:hypothetical protein